MVYYRSWREDFYPINIEQSLDFKEGIRTTKGRATKLHNWLSFKDRSIYVFLVLWPLILLYFICSFYAFYIFSGKMKSVFYAIFYFTIAKELKTLTWKTLFYINRCAFVCSFQWWKSQVSIMSLLKMIQRIPTSFFLGLALQWRWVANELVVASETGADGRW